MTPDDVRFKRNEAGLTNARLADLLGKCVRTFEKWQELDTPGNISKIEWRFPDLLTELNDRY